MCGGDTIFRWNTFGGKRSYKSLYGKVSYALPEYGVIMEKEDFADSVDLAFLVKSEFSDKLKKQLTDISCGKLELSEETNLLADFA